MPSSARMESGAPHPRRLPLGSAMTIRSEQRQSPCFSRHPFGCGWAVSSTASCSSGAAVASYATSSAGYPATSLENLKIPNTFFDGLFHAATYIFVVLGLIVLWRTAHRSHLWWSWKLLAGTMLIGFGVQRGRGRHRSPSARHPPRQRNGPAGSVDLLRRGVSDLGRGDDRRRLGALSLRPTDVAMIAFLLNGTSGARPGPSLSDGRASPSNAADRGIAGPCRAGGRSSRVAPLRRH